MNRKVSITISLLMLFTLGLPAQGQTRKKSASKARSQKTKEPSISEKATTIWNNAKSSWKATTKRVKDELGIKGGTKGEDIRTKYMPIYSEEGYQGGDANMLIQQCRTDFYNRYPSSFILSSVIPQKTWQSEPVKRDGGIVGYLQTMYCYVLAKDGNDGYINTEYVFQRYKNVGDAYEHVEGKWPGVVRTDVLTTEVYEKIKD